MSTTHYSLQYQPAMHLRPVVHVADLAASIAFYQQLGGEIIHGGRDTAWVLMQLGTTQIVLVARPPDPGRGESAVELTFGAAMPLDEMERRLHQAGVRAAEVTTDHDFGEQLQVRSPDGLLIKISQREPEV
jgi:catechol 2,3-dioxygenase-like lactoylglutathione lyase family enzyme